MCTKYNHWFPWPRRTGYEGLRDQLVTEQPKHECYIVDRWYCELAGAQRKARCARNWVYISRFVSLAGVAVLPPIITFETFNGAENAALSFLALIVSVIVAFSGGILSVTRVQQRWRLYHSLGEKLARTGWELANRGCTFCSFRSSIERDLATAEAVYQSSVAIVTAPEPAPQPSPKNDQDDPQLKVAS
jgi:hypothetical protein